MPITSTITHIGIHAYTRAHAHARDACVHLHMHGSVTRKPLPPIAATHPARTALLLWTVSASDGGAPPRSLSEARLLFSKGADPISKGKSCVKAAPSQSPGRWISFPGRLGWTILRCLGGSSVTVRGVF